MKNCMQPKYQLKTNIDLESRLPTIWSILIISQNQECDDIVNAAVLPGRKVTSPQTHGCFETTGLLGKGFFFFSGVTLIQIQLRRESGGARKRQRLHKVCEAADAPAPSLASDMWKHFGYSPSQAAFRDSGVFPVTRKVMGRHRLHCGATTYTHLWHVSLCTL